MIMNIGTYQRNPAVQIVDRFLKEQATFNKEQNQWIA